MNLYKNTQAPANTTPKNIKIALQMNLVFLLAFSEHAMGQEWAEHASKMNPTN